MCQTECVHTTEQNEPIGASVADAALSIVESVTRSSTLDTLGWRVNAGTDGKLGGSPQVRRCQGSLPIFVCLLCHVVE
jgi:hypothetical protein